MTILYLYLRFFCGPWDEMHPTIFADHTEGNQRSFHLSKSQYKKGCYFVSYGIDRGSPMILYGKPRATFKEAWQIVKEFRKKSRWA